MMLRRTGFMLAWAVMIIAGGTLAWAADEEGDAGGVIAAQTARGHDLARIWCSGCHAIELDGGAGVRTEAPAFAGIANREGQSRDAIRKYLINPHPPMPNLALSRAQMRNLASYIMSLKDDEAAP